MGENFGWWLGVRKVWDRIRVEMNLKRFVFVMSGWWDRFLLEEVGLLIDLCEFWFLDEYWGKYKW